VSHQAHVGRLRFGVAVARVEIICTGGSLPDVVDGPEVSPTRAWRADAPGAESGAVMTRRA